MNVRKESQHETYDAVVIGSGMGGIGAAAVLAYGGRRVLVVERHDRAGGFAHGFTRRKYRFDSAVHITSGCNPVGHGQGAIIHRLLELLGTRDQCTFVPVDPFYQAVFPGLSLAIPTGVQEFVDRHIDAFPHERQGIKKFMRLCTRVFHEVRKIPPELPPAEATVAPDGDHLVTVTTLVPCDVGESWRERKACLEKALLNGAERVLPGITDSLRFAEGATPRTMERYTLNYLGSIYGWGQTPDQAGASRLGRRTPVGGLYPAGHWTQPGGGVFPSLVSGIQTAQLALGEEGDALVAELVGTGPLGFVEHSTSRAQ